MVDLFGEKILDVPYYYMSEDLELNGMRVCVSRTGYTSELGYEIYLYDAMANGMKPLEHGARDRQRRTISA
jgi:aminomethyltransferase